MSAVLAPPAPIRTPDTGPGRGPAMLALARVEAVRLLRHPVTVCALLLFLAPWIYRWITGTVNRFPVLHEDAVTVQFFGLIILGCGAMIAANLAALRARRHRTDALYDVLVLPAAWRTGALLLALLPYAGLVAVLVGIRAGVLAALPGAAGRPDPFELLTTPLLVLLLGTLGVLLARLVRSAVVAPLVALAVTAVVGAVASVSAAPWRVLLPVVLPDRPFALPADLGGRPAGRHLLYLVGLVLIMAVAALVRSGARGPRTAAAAALAVALTAGAGAAQFLPDDSVTDARVVATDNPVAVQTCRKVATVTYCAFDGFTPWIAGWDTVLRGVRRAVPDGVPTGPALAVRQRVWAHDYPLGGGISDGEEDAARAAAWRRTNAAAGTPEAIPVGMSWGDGRSEAVFAAAVAFRLITGHVPDGRSSVCGARGALLVWLAGQATPRALDGLRELDETSWGALSFSDNDMFNGGSSVPDADAASGLALLGKSSGDPAALIRRHWTELTAADTGVDRFAALLGVPAAEQPPAAERVATCAD